MIQQPYFTSPDIKHDYLRASVSRLLKNVPEGTSPYYEPANNTHRSQRYLPHWEQEGKLYFITFRLADSLPADKLCVLKHDREQWQRLHPVCVELTPDEKAEYNRLFNRRVQDWLDQGYGFCALRNPGVAKIVAESLHHFENVRYWLGEWVIMPNHVHVLALTRPGYTLKQILHTWKSFSANRCNKVLRRSGEFWQDERHDHIVRSPVALYRISEYILDNPTKAGTDVCEASWLGGSMG